MWLAFGKAIWCLPPGFLFELRNRLETGCNKFVRVTTKGNALLQSQLSWLGVLIFVGFAHRQTYLGPLLRQLKEVNMMIQKACHTGSTQRDPRNQPNGKVFQTEAIRQIPRDTSCHSAWDEWDEILRLLSYAWAMPRAVWWLPVGALGQGQAGSEHVCGLQWPNPAMLGWAEKGSPNFHVWWAVLSFSVKFKAARRSSRTTSWASSKSSGATFAHSPPPLFSRGSLQITMECETLQQ